MEIMCKCGHPFEIEYNSVDNALDLLHRGRLVGWVGGEHWPSMSAEECAKELKDFSIIMQTLVGSLYANCEIPW